ncbi:nuclear matrix protein NMP200 [Coprinopsis cinerea okayama7|uniref:Pre-mRNA-processing factor 19 n=1 Tax=Coprinopsis cinerea (strain Okayama-7 / 130 / ATCC MYA-4618 / FGSC 9003) TaxID=240176 RepID=A8N170_COPC7|nr:nuclear matrix protein NMP200 [Coprinopsis cinerea okayama7\|eukprot:XP_001828618.1 nuclear matrix protein NMP200 [Coprinopsis cinerea okayama7\
MFFCAISGEPPQEPVVSAKSGKVYEKRLIVKYIHENGTDPITGDKLEESDLIAIKASPENAPPRPPTNTSIPALLQLLQNEWDAMVLSTHALEQKYNATRQELSYALYSQDAANRVVARLIRERDAAREALANVQASMGIAPSQPTGGEDVEMAENGGVEEGLPADIVTQIDETHAVLSAARKKRKTPPGYAAPAEVKTYKATHTIPSLHSASPAGITSIALSTSNPSQFLTGGNDHIVQLYDRSTDKVLASLKGHSKKVNHVAFREREGDNTLLLSAGADKIAKIWGHDGASGEYIPKATIRTHKGELTGLAVHPTKTLLALSSVDKTYSLHDLSTFQQVFRSAPTDEPFSSMAVHPDGTFLAIGTPTSTIHIYDVRAGAIAASLTPPDAVPFTVHTLSFSENGYNLVAPNSLSSIALWDLRKEKITASIDLGDDFKVNKVLCDASAQFIGVAGNQGARIFAQKSREELLRLEEGGEVSDFAFGAQGKEIWGATGREVRIWGASA